jgi:hypothetical protein
VILTAVADPGSVFVQWNGACAGAGACTVTMDAAKSATARFELLRRVSVRKTGTGHGTVTGTEAGIACGHTCAVDVVNGSAVELTATAERGSRLVGWRGPCSGAGGCVFIADRGEQVEVEFVDVAPPTVRALVSSGRRGGTASLRYRLADNSGSARVNLTVARNGRTLARIARPLASADGRVRAARWTVSRKTKPGRLSFCVRAVDAARNASATGCARLMVR